MSYILEALKKADRERSIGEVPDLESTHWGVRQSGRGVRWPWVVAGLLIFNALLLVFLLGRGTSEQSAPEVSVEAAGSQSGVTQADAHEELLQRLEKPEREQSRQMRPRVNFPPPPAAAARPALPATEPEAVPVSKPRVIESQAPLTVDGSDSSLPEWGELPLEFRSGFPLPRIDVHVYAEDPARRFVLIDLKKYREGDTLGNGAVLEKIGPASIQLLYQGTRFRVNR